jgi:cell shape-determining protein MreC
MKRRSSHSSKNRKIAFTAGFFALVISVGIALPTLFHYIGAFLMTPVHTLSQWYENSEQAIPVMLREKQSLQDEIKNLEDRLISASGQNLTLQRLQDENTRLRSLLGAVPGERTMARILARPSEMPYDLLQIDQGSEAGITEHALVYATADQVIGTVRQVTNHYSFVELFTSPGVEMTGFISGPDIIATVEGIGGGVARVRVPQGIPLRVGDLVYVPSIEPGLFGQIDFVENRPSQPEQFGYISLPIALHSLWQVAVTATPVEPASIESIERGAESIVNQRLLREEANTGSFEELLAPTTTATITSPEL